MSEHVSFVQPYWEPVTRWERKWQQPSNVGTAIVATLGPRPGNTNKPPPNNYKVLKWVKVPNKKIDLNDQEFRVVVETRPKSPVKQVTVVTGEEVPMSIDTQSN